MLHKRLVPLLAFAMFALPTLAAVTGSVMTADGKPVAGARVSVYATESADARRVRLLSSEPDAVPLATTQTDAKGSFSLESPKNPVAVVRVALRGYEPASRAVERDEQSVIFVTRKGEPRTATITSGGKPVAGATVVLSFRNADLIAKTDTDGRYEAPDPKNLTGITVLHPEYAIDDETFFGVAESAIRTKLNRTLRKAIPLSGHVVASDGKTPVAKATLTVDGWPLATSADDGSFTIDRAPAKWEALVARKDSLLAVRAYSKDASLTLRLAKGATFSGRVLDAKTKLPATGAVVLLGVRRSDSRSGTAEVEVDGKGMYSLVAPAGTYGIFVSHPAYDPDFGDIGAAAGQQATRDFSLQPLAKITGSVLDEAKQPVAGATLAPEPTGDMFAGMRGGGARMMMRENSTSSSGPDGRFSLRLNGEREVRVRASKKGLPTGRTEPMTLAAGERKNGVVISLPVGFAVTGKVTDGDGNALSGALVTAAETQGRGGANMQRMMISIGGPQRADDDAVQTGTDGAFSMRLKEGSYDFTIRREGYSTKIVRAHAVTTTGALPIEVRLDPAVEITGRVTRSGSGVEGVQIFVMGGGAGMDTNTVTGPDGSFTLSNLSPGQVGVFLVKVADFISDQRTLTAPGRDVVLELPPGGRVSGRVVEKGTRKAVTSFEAGITQSRGGGPMVRMGPPQVKPFTTDDGSFVLENVPAGSATLVASAPGFVTGRLNVTVEEGKSLDDLVIELDTGVKLTGKVTGPNGSGLSDVSVGLAPSMTGTFALSGSDKRTTTDANGEYTLDALTPGEETLTFSHEKYLATSKPVTLKGREMRLDVQLERGARVSGVVVTESGAPVGEADVRAISAGGSAALTQTNGSGAFEFESLAPARYRFVANRAGYAEGVVEDFDTVGGAPLRIVLKTGGTIYGRVSGVSESDLGNTFVAVRGSGGFSQTPVDASGNYRLEGAPIGNVQVSANVRSAGGGRSTPTQAVRVEAGASVQVDLVFRTDLVVQGRVTRNGKPLGTGSIMFAPRGGGGGMLTANAIDADGHYSVTGLEDGNYVVTVIDMQRISGYTTNYEVRGSGTFDIAFTTGTLRGRVVDVTNNRPLSGATVTVRATSTVEMFRGRGAVTDENGVFAVDTVPSGTYSVTASLDTYGSDSKEVVVNDSPVDNIELRLAASDGVTFKVVDGRDGRPISASAALYDMQGGLVNETRGNSFMFAPEPSTSAITVAVAQGSYIATVYTSNYAPVHVAVTAPSTRTIALTPGGRIEVESKHSEPRRAQLIDSFGLVYARIGPMPRRYELVPRSITPFERIAPGRYTLQLLGSDDTTVVDQVPVVVLEGQTTKTQI